MDNLHQTRTKTKLSLTLLLIFALLSFILLLATLVVTPPKKHDLHKTSLEAITPPLKLHVSKHVQLAHASCDGTLYPELCVSTLSSILPTLSSTSLPNIISAAVNVTIGEVESSESKCSGIRRQLSRDLGPLQRRALADCLELLDDTVSQLRVAVKDLSKDKAKTAASVFYDMETLFSAAMTNQYTCLEGFARGGEAVRGVIQRRLLNITHHVSNSLVMLKKIPGAGAGAGAGATETAEGRGFPAWITRRERRLLQAAPGSTGMKFDAVVAKDGTGNFKTVGEAVAAAPNSSATRFVIYIKAGEYLENVEVQRKKTKLMFVGDGIGKTVIKASRSVGGNWTTFRSATVAVVGRGFLARGITFENSAGPSNHQAVALRSGSDLSAFYQCSFVGYQDTLYVHSLRQFYRECDVYGTVDFVFGNAAAVLQKCNLYARKPNPNQKNIFTAQGREDPNQNTGISLINCKIAAAEDLIPVLPSFKSYLGRPWKAYSRTVILLSEIDGLIEAAGWLEWNGDFALKTLYYREYMNRGSGANTTGRVTWPGYRVINSSAEASGFTAGAFLRGAEWLNSTGFPFYLGLS